MRKHDCSGDIKHSNASNTLQDEYIKSLRLVPVGQTEHLVRVTLVPPSVRKPAGHVLHVLAPAELYLWPAPQGRQFGLAGGE